MGKRNDSRQRREHLQRDKAQQGMLGKRPRMDAPESARVRDLREMWLEVAEEPDHKKPFRPCNEISEISEAAMGQG